MSETERKQNSPSSARKTSGCGACCASRLADWTPIQMSAYSLISTNNWRASDAKRRAYAKLSALWWNMKQTDPNVLERRRVQIVRLIGELQNDYLLTNQDIAEILGCSNVAITDVKKHHRNSSLRWIYALKGVLYELEKDLDQ